MAGRKTKKELDTAKELAYILYLNNTSSVEIAERTNVSQQTVSAWVKDGSWKEKRAAKTVTRTELVNLTLAQISNLLAETEEGMSSKDADKLIKLAALIEKLDKKNSPVIAMEIFIQFTGYMQNNLSYDKDIDMAFIKKLNKYHDAFITSLMTN